MTERHRDRREGSKLGDRGRGRIKIGTEAGIGAGEAAVAIAVDRITCHQDSRRCIEERGTAWRVAWCSNHTHPEHFVTIAQFGQRQRRLNRADIGSTSLHRGVRKNALKVGQSTDVIAASFLRTST